MEQKRTLGVIGGLGPIATAHFMELVIRMTEATTDQEHLDMILYNRPSIPDRTGYILDPTKPNPLPEMIRVGIMATDGTIRSRLFQQELEKHGITPLIPGEAGQKCVMSVIYDDIKANRPAGMHKFELASKDLKDQGAQAIILGCTELSLVKRDYPIGAGFLDAMEVLAQTCVLRCGGKLKEEYQELISK